MAKSKKSEKQVEQLAEKIDWSGLAESGSFDVIEPVDSFIDTGVLALNFICSGKFIGGGVPTKRITEIFGDASTGKSLITNNICAGIQKVNGIPIIVDAEQSFNPEFAQLSSGLDPSKLFITSSDTLEGCFNQIYKAVRLIRSKTKITVPIVVIYDSIAASPSESEFAETGLDMESATVTEKKAAGAGLKVGDRARTCSKHFRNIPNFLKANNATLVVINQLRTKIGVMFGDPSTTAGGGRALEYYASCRLKLTANKLTKDKYDAVNGVNINVKNVKNKCHKPFGESRCMHLLFEKGINPFGGLLEILIQTERISGSGGNYVVNLNYTEDGEETKFKSSKERNDVPPEILLKCPKLVDAKSPKDVQYYLDLYQHTIDAINNEIVSESDFNLDAD